MMRALLAAALCAGLAVHAAAPANAQNYPTRPIKVVVPFPPGGPTDGMARIISDRLGAVLGQPIVVENKGGAGGGIGGKFVSDAEPDGYTILMSPGGSLTTGPMINPNIGYDPVKSLASVAQLVEMPIIVAVNPDLPVNAMAEVVPYAKANPGKLKWGSQGFGTAPHLLIELFKLENNVNVIHVPYRGTGPMLNGILGGEVQIVADPSTTVLPHIEAGKLRPLAIAGDARIAAAAERADRGRDRLPLPGVAVLARRDGAGRDAARDHRQAQRRVPRGARRAGNPQAARRARRRGQDRHAGGARHHAGRRAHQVEQGGQGGEPQDGVTSAVPRSIRPRTPDRQ